MIAYITEVTDDSFENFKSKGVVLVDIYANWCGPCKNMSPIIDEISNEFHNKVKVGKLDVDKNSIVPASLKVRSIPTIVIFKDGEEVSKIVGSVSKAEISEELEKHL